MSISHKGRKTTWTPAELDAAAWLRENNYPVNQTTIDEVLKKSQDFREYEQRAEREWSYEYQQPLPSYHQPQQQRQAVQPHQEVLPRQAASTPVVKYTHHTNSKVTSNRDIQLHQYRPDSIWFGLGVTCLVYWWAGSSHVIFLAIGSGAAAIGGFGAILRSISIWNADRFGDNAVQMTESKEATRQETQRQITERERIKQHAKLSELQIQQQREAQDIQRLRLEQRQTARQHQVEFHNRTVSETHYRATDQAVHVGHPDYGPFDDDMPVQTSPETAIVPQADVLAPVAQGPKAVLLDWFERVYQYKAYNDRGVIVASKIGHGVKVNPFGSQFKQHNLMPHEREEIKAYIADQRGGTSWIVSSYNNQTQLNLHSYPDFATLRNYIESTWF